MSTVSVVLGAVLQSAWRYRWTFTVPIATCVLPATLIALNLPDAYRATAIVHVQMVSPERIGSGLPEVRASLPEEMLATVRSRLIARAPVEAAASILYPDKPQEDLETLDAVRGQFDYEQIGGSAFSASLTGGSAKQAAGATNALLRAFFENERNEGLRRAEGNKAFHEKELAAVQTSRATVLAKLDAFRKSHADTLPERKEVIQEDIRRHTTDITAQESVIGSARTRIQALDDQLAALETTVPKDLPTRAGAAEEALGLQLAQAQSALAEAQKQLAQLRVRYTEKHPDVIQMRTAVEVHRKSVNETVAALERVRKQAAGEAGRTAVRAMEARRKTLQDLRKSVQDDIEQAERRRTALRTRRAELQAQLAAIPATEAALRPLQRELDEADKVVESRRRDATAARAAVEFYREGDIADVTGYRVDTWAREPPAPTGPSRWRYFATAVVIGALIGYGLLLLRRRVEGGRVEKVDDVTGLFPDAVVVGMPDLRGGSAGRRGLPVADIGLAIYVVLCFGLSAMAIAAHRGWAGAPEWIHSLIGG